MSTHVSTDSSTGPDAAPATGARLTPSRGGSFARIASVGAHRPGRMVTNDEICEVLDSSDEWIRERTGIVTRYFADPGDTVTDIAEPAARKALERAGLTAGDIDVVLVATVTHLQQTPAAAALLAHRLGATPAAAFDISVACAGFCHGLSVAEGLIRAGTATHVLVVGVEKLSDIISPTDRSTAFIFGDGAGAVIVSATDDDPGVGPTIWGSDGARWEYITSDSYTSVRKQLVAQWPVVPQLEPALAEVSASAHTNGTAFDIGCDVSADIAAGLADTSTDTSTHDSADDAPVVWPTLRMQGQGVFRWAIWEMAPVARKAMDAAGVVPSDLVAFIPHQANVRIIDALAKQIGLPDTVVIARDIARTGNTSGASIPLAMDALVEQQPELSGGLALLIGFGAGLSYAAQVVRLP